MNLKNEKLFKSKFVGTGASFYKKRIYRAAVSKRLRNTVLNHSQILSKAGSPVIIILSSCEFSISVLLIILRKEGKKEGKKEGRKKRREEGRKERRK